MWLDLLIDGTLVQGVLALGIVGAWLYMLVTTGAAPEALTTVTMIIVGVFFGTLTEKARARVRSK